MLNDRRLEEVHNFTYLGDIIDQQGGTDAYVKTRISKARADFILLKTYGAPETVHTVFKDNTYKLAYMRKHELSIKNKLFQ